MRVQRVFTLFLFALCSIAPAQNVRPRPDLRGIGIEQHLDSQIPLDLMFRDESGAAVPLKKYFDEKPVLLVPVYFGCPMLCSQVLSGVVAGLRPLSMRPGRDFEVVAVSFDPADTPPIAKSKREHYSRSYSSQRGTSGWHFLTGENKSIQPLMQSIGFHYRFDAAHNIFIHASGIMVLTPDGRLGRYLYGVDYEPKDLKLSLIEASHNRIGSPVDQILLFCYHYDPATGKYGALVINMLRGAGILTLTVFSIAGWFLFRRDFRQYRA
jgi:protein SCO1/2